MADELDLVITTPERELLHERVSEVQLPGKEGYMGILPGHAALLSELAVGPVSYLSGGTRKHLALNGGFVEVRDDHVRVLADTAERAEEIDIPRAERALHRAQERLANPSLGVDVARALYAIERAQARIEAARAAQG